MAEENEKRTPVFDWDKGEFAVNLNKAVVTAAEGEAVKQIILKAYSTARGVFLIYANVEDPEDDHVYGNDAQEVLTRADLNEEARISELERAIEEALIHDPWITEVYDIVIERLGTDEATASFKVGTVFDREVIIEGVELNG